MENINKISFFSEEFYSSTSLTSEALGLFVSRLPHPIIVHKNGKVLFLNSAVLNTTGYSLDEIIGADIINFVIEKDQSKVSENIKNRKKEDIIEDYEFSLILKNGARKRVSVSSKIIFFDDDWAVISLFSDISQLKKTEKKLKESEDRLRLIIENLSEIVFQTTTEGLWTFLNPSWEVITGYSIEESLGKHFKEYISSENIEEDIIVFRNLLESKQDSVRREIKFKNKNGGFRWLEVYARLILNKNGEVAGSSGTLNDITLRKEYENILLRKEQLLSASAEASEILLINPNINEAINNSFQIIGRASDACAAFIFVNSKNDETGERTSSLMYEWISGSFESQINNPLFQNISFDSITQLLSPIMKKSFFSSSTAKLSDSSKTLLSSINIKSFLLDPIFIKNSFWGFICLADCFKERNWSDAEKSILFSYSASLSGAVERKQYEVDLLKAKEEADKGNRAKSEFLANMSHEIRTPLNAILGFAELLQDYTKDEKYRHYLSGISMSGKGLLKIINDILDLSKIEAGKIFAEPEPVNIHLLLTEIKSMFVGLALEKRINFNIITDTSVPKIVYVDETRIRQILLNIIGNAVKFTNQGSVSVSVFAIKKSYSNRIDLVAEIKDTGIGIPADQQETIFEAFRQVDSDNRRNFGGTGLGLTITKRLVEMMNGKIFLTSEVGKGSLFKIQFYDLKFSNDTLFLNDKSQAKALKNLKFNNALILLAEDVESNRVVINEFLKNHQVKLVFAENGWEAVELSLRQKPNLILMDIQMPVMDGIDAAKIIKQTHCDINIPIIALTASLLDGDKKPFSVFDSIITKPVSRLELLAEMNRFLHSEHIIEETLPQQKDIYTSDAPLSENQIDAVNNLLEGDIYKKFLTIKNAGVIDDVIDFSENLIAAARQNNLYFLEKYGITVKQLAENFKIDQLKKMLEQFDYIINNSLSKE